MATTNQNTNFAALNGRVFNHGNKTARVMHSIGVGKESNGVAYAWEERKNRNAMAGNDSPLLYFVCEVNGKRGVTVKCNDDEFLDYVLKNPKERYTVAFRVAEFTNPDDGRKMVYPEMVKID